MLLPPHKLFFSNILMGSKHFLKSTPFTVPLTPSSRTHLFHSYRLLFSTFPAKPIFKIRPFCLRASGFSYVSRNNVPRPVYLENPEMKRDDVARLEVLKHKMKELGIDISTCKTGQYNHIICPQCKGGNSAEKSLCLLVTKDGESALWICFRAKCRWKGTMRAFADGRSSHGNLNQIAKVKQDREITEESLELEPLCDEVLKNLGTGSLKELIENVESCRVDGPN